MTTHKTATITANERQETPVGNASGTAPEKDRDQETPDWADLLCVTSDDVIQEIGWDEDADSSISEALEDLIGSPLLEEGTDELVDVVLLWFREEDGDVVDGLVDATRSLGEDGRIWLLTPAAGTSGTIEPGVIAESAQLAGLVQTSSERLGDWQGACLVTSGKKR